MRALASAAAIVVVLATPTMLLAHDGAAERIKQLTALIAQQPGNATLLAERGELYRAGGDRTRALADLDRAVALDPTLSAAELGRAKIFLDRGELRAADAAATRVLTRQPRLVDALIVRARARARLGLVRESAADFTRALNERPLPDLYIERARVVSRAKPADIKGALLGIDEGIARLGPIVTLELEAIELELKRGEYDAALARVERVSAQTPRKESWLARRGAILERAGRVDEARATYRSALDAAEHLPNRIRQTRASTTLIEQLQRDLERLRTH